MTETTLPVEIQNDRRVAIRLAVVAFSLTMLLSEGAITGSDGRSMYEVTKSISENGNVRIDSSLGVPGRNGAYYSRYGIGLSLVATVGYMAVRPLARHSASPDLLEQAGVAATMPVIFALSVIALYSFARRLGGRPRSSSYIALGIIFGTFLWPYSKEFFSEPLVALCTVIGIDRTTAGRPTGAGAAVGIACVTRPQALALAPILLLPIFKQAGCKGVLRFAVPVGIATAAIVFYNWLRFASPLDFGYEGYGFTTPISVGALGLLFHPSKSIFLFAPSVILLPFALGQLYTREQSAFWLLVSNFLVVLAMAATWVSWGGGWAWGPRLLIPGIVPALAALPAWTDGSRQRSRAVAALVVAGGLVSLPAMVVSTRAQQLDNPPPTIGPGVIRQYQLIGPTAEYTKNHLYEGTGGMNRQYINLWQIGATRVLGMRGLLMSIAISALLLTVAIGAWLSVRRLLLE